jgi:tetratricopeptide (TPR) repeat protein
MKRARRRRGPRAAAEPTGAEARSRPAATPPAAPLPLRHPAVLIAIAVAALCAVVSVSYRLYDTDLWLLLAHGRAITTLHRIPRENLWTWPGYGMPDPAAAWWAFRLLAWWLWSAGGVVALFAWRWLSTLAAFGILWSAARRMGARGLLPLVTTTLCVLAYRIRSDIRPETFSAILFAAVLWLLETDRAEAGGRTGEPPSRDCADPQIPGSRATHDSSPGGGTPHRVWLIVPIALLWVNTHIGWYAGFVLLGAHLADALVAALLGTHRRAALGRARRLVLVGLAALAASLLNPTGWHALAQPFEFALFWRGEPLYRTVGELHPLVWSANLRNGLPLLMAGWPLLLLWRARRRGLDVAEAVLCGLFTGAAVSSQRFLGSFALAAAPYVARDLGELVARRRGPAWLARPWSSGLVTRPWSRGLLAAAACVAVSLPEWTRSELPLGVGLDLSGVPVAACDFVRDHGLRGRVFNPFHFGGYLAYRFWPDRGRLPFMSTQPEPGDDRQLYLRAFSDLAAWRALEQRHRFDYLVLDRNQDPGDRLPDFLDQDTAWVMVFADDAAELLVRRRGPLAAVADSFGYRVLPAGRAGRERLVSDCGADTALRARAVAELGRQAAGSPWNGHAHHLLGLFAAMDGRIAEAHDHLVRALEKKPLLPGAHELLGLVALEQGRPGDAVREFERERALHGPAARLEVGLGQAWQRLGDPGRARAAYLRAVRLEPQNAEARDSLATLDAAR